MLQTSWTLYTHIYFLSSSIAEFYLTRPVFSLLRQILLAGMSFNFSALLFSARFSNIGESKLQKMAAGQMRERGAKQKKPPVITRFHI